MVVWKRRPVWWLVVVVVAALVGIGSTIPWSEAATAPAAGKTYTLAVARSGQCLDVTGGSTANGTPLQQWGCGAGQANQQWKVADQGSGRFNLTNVHSGLCLDVPGGSTASGVRLQQWGCGGVQANQLWKFTASRAGTYQVVNVNSGLCLSDQGASTSSGAAVIQETCTANSNKRWTFTAVAASGDPAPGTKTITVAADGTGDVTTVQAAIDRVPSGNKTAVTIAVKKGVYRGVVTVPADKPFIRLQGHIEGDVDFIFGGGVAVFEQCEIHSLARGAVTAASTPAARTYGFLFDSSTLTGAAGAASTSLGRPWRPDAQVLYRSSTIGSYVAAGQPWTDMSGNAWKNARFSEFQNTGAGAAVNTKRPQMSAATAANYTPQKYLAGTDGWNPVAAPTSGGSTPAGTVCAAKSYGATGNGTTKDPAALQKAVTACAGKGTVELAGGRFLSGPLTLAGNTTFQIDSGATLLASPDAADYPASGSHLTGLLRAVKASNVTITGGGTIDGQGAPWWAEIKKEKAAGAALSPRPTLIDLDTVTTATISGITVTNAPNVHIVMHRSSHVTIDHITIASPADSPNTDGIDVWSSNSVKITNSSIDAGDDDLAIDSSAPDGPAHDIELTGCTILHGHGLSIGSYTAGGVYNVNIHDNTLKGTTAGARIKTARDRGGDVHDVTYAHLTMTGVTTPIEITAYYPKVPADGDPAQSVTATTPYYHDITIAHVTATGAGAAGVIVGVPERPVTGVRLDTVTISARTGLTIRNATVTGTSTTTKAASGPAYILQSNGRLN